MAEVEELEVPGSISLAEDERDDIDGLKEIVVGDHVKQEILVRAGDSEAIARRLGQRTQSSATYIAEEQDAKNIADEDLFEIDAELVEQREAEAQARAAEIEEAGAASAKANEEAAAAGQSVTEQTMEAHQEATEGSASWPSQHAPLDELAAANNITWEDETTVADKQARLQAEGVSPA